MKNKLEYIIDTDNIEYEKEKITNSFNLFSIIF